MSGPVENEPQHPLPAARAAAPGAVQAAAILLYVGGGLTVVFALAGLGSGAARSTAYMVYGLFYVGLAYGVQRGRRWARRAVLVLCAVGVALAGILLVTSGVSSAVSTVAWPLVYAILLSTDTARAWFRRDRPEA
ncbi:hypothetical protein GCM10020358_26000 [Amorphoplanes nipponensis]|uniref:Uncharacterized protein n=1 Tax=Actinoplanes nipponensis TaxID=135950 RepID=A0A919JLZ2_9ACTN|nr:hypothetical protein [Actinoplanes nipponensis]GIE53021.1 hypothetical protein Ani05nite_65550 [Actinoplanes nipponensis]